MSNIVALDTSAKHTGTPSRSYARAALEDFVTGLTDLVIDMSVWTSLDDAYGAYARWAQCNRPRFVLSRNQFAKELRTVAHVGTSQRGGRTGFRFLALSPLAV